MSGSGENPAGTPPRSPLRILIVDDDLDESVRLQKLLEASHDLEFEVAHAPTVEDGLRRLRDGDFAAVLLDLGLEQTVGSDTLGPARVAATTVPFVVLGTEEDEDLAVRAHRFGAQDYLVKSECGTRVLVRTLRHALERHGILTDLARARQFEHYLATHDYLTGLPNRLALMDQLRRALAVAARSGGRVALLFLDLDRFKNINDSLGHGRGDELLCTVSRRLSGILRSSDMIARLGGDEFIIMLQNLQRDYDAAVVARKIADAMSTPFVLGGKEYHVTTSIGVALYPEDGLDSDVLLRNADMAMYHAKNAGPNRFSYYKKSLNEGVTKRLEIENGLQDALIHDALRVHFQPQVHVGLGIVTGAEALLRWQHPERGMVPPSDFIPLAEDAGLMPAIGEWVLRAACAQAAQWPSPGGQKLQVAVNVSTRQLADCGFPECVTQTLRDTGLEPDRLEIEITEHSVLQEVGVTLGAVEFLRSLGVRVVIDDFGTGYSALSALKNLPIDGIKIDRSFVQDIVTNPADETITRGLITIADGLGLSITAEGIEGVEQLELLRSLGVQQMQGYFFAKPMAADAFSSQLATDPGLFTRELD